MPAVAYRSCLRIDDPESLIDVEVEVPEPEPNDLLIEVKAVSVNPVDVKVRANRDPGGDLRILGYDGAGTVTSVGSAVTRFAVGDDVYYAGSLSRPGSNAACQLVDERIVGPKPTTLSFAEAAALPLTTLTAWEALVDRLHLGPGSTGTMLALGAAGGTGSILIQLTHALTNLTIIGSASRPESVAWIRELGVDAVVDHHGDLADQLHADHPEGIDYIFSPHSAGQIDTFVQLLRPGGQIVAIDDPPEINLSALKNKSLSWHWEFMFTKPLFAPLDATQHEILTRAAALIDVGTLRSTMTEHLGPIDAVNLREAHRRIEAGSTIGKLVLG